MTLRSAAWPAACLGALLIVSGCGSGSGDDSLASVASSPAPVSPRVEAPGGATTGGGATACTGGERPGGPAYAVSEHLADDSGGGLLVLDAPGQGGVQLAILATGAPVTVGEGRDACAVVAGAAWWRIRSADGLQGWVDSGGLSPRG